MGTIKAVNPTDKWKRSRAAFLQPYSLEKKDVDFTRIFDGEKIIGVLNFNNMIPVDKSVVRKMNIRIGNNDDKSEKAYKNLCAKELDRIQKSQDAIVKKANKLYRMITTEEANIILRRRCVDFKKLEAVLEKRKSK